MPHSTAPLDGGEMGHVMRKKNTPLLPEAKAVLARTLLGCSFNIHLENICADYLGGLKDTHCLGLIIYVDIIQYCQYEIGWR